MDTRKALEVMGMFLILTVVMVSQAYAYVETYQITSNMYSFRVSIIPQ